MKCKRQRNLGTSSSAKEVHSLQQAIGGNFTARAKTTTLATEKMF